jgi:asparagine synthase (glutamine-hydrolysing)
MRRFDGRAIELEPLRAMTDTLDHRGPDGAGHQVWGDTGFGHRRLSIIDVAGSSQPMSSADGHLHVTFNGEILNYRELRRRSSYPFRTAGDTEVLLARFAERGAAAVHELVGQFAFAMLDERDGALWLFRDRLGVLPLYWYRDVRMFAFASEIKALLPVLPQAPEVDRASIGDHLAQRSVPAPYTLLRGIHKLPAGHHLRLGRDGDVDVQPYWRLPTSPRPRLTHRDAVAEVEHALDDAVRSALVADVPVGAYLSGGVDSSLITALAVRAREGAGIDTFSAGFGDARVDEVDAARSVSAELGTRHHEVTVTPDDFAELWPRLTWIRDAPLSEPADVAVFRLAELARRHVKVVLSGEGSDELFAGYPKYRMHRLIDWSGLMPSWARRCGVALAEPLAAGHPRARIAVRALGAPDGEERLRAWFAPFTDDERARLGADVSHGQPDVMAHAPSGLFERMLFFDTHSWLADNLLERGDRMSMAASLELRPPFLDHRLVELASTLPASAKLRHGTGKWVVRAVAGRHLPRATAHRRKAGFRVPLDTWFRGGLREMSWDLLGARTAFVAEVLDPFEIRAMLLRHEHGEADEAIRIWTLLGLEVWYQTYRTSGITGTATIGSTVAVG